ncbi:hypothetical protein EVAR_36671_1 [Eumeta japonica]|uniref:Mos1 transposase HTH domain-containing protein n=1 Tax=Eumeta variegata TaxID=151549 RepID=A0A4C1ZC25_EUMVA|nr:hypothetical protein EVAR_36671_1 [Eumeta japonica]
MDLTRVNLRAMIYFDIRHGLTQKQYIDQLISTFEDGAPLKIWLSEFNHEWSMLSDEFKEGRHESVVVPNNIDVVRELIMQDHNITYPKIKVSLGKRKRESKARTGTEMENETVVKGERENRIGIKNLMGTENRIEDGTGIRIESGIGSEIENGDEVENKFRREKARPRLKSTSID